MNEQDRSAAMSHDAAWELLPWYINGTLEAAERERVDEHLRSCLLCYRELDEQQRLQELVRESDTVRISPRPSFDTLMHRIDSGATDDSGRSIGYRARLVAWLPVAAALLAVGVVLIVLFSANPDRGGEFRTLSSETPSRQTAAPLLQIVFAEQATEEEILNVVAGIGGRIVDGPSDAGVYRVQLADAELPAGTLDQLRTDERVRFVGQAYTAPSP